LAPSKAERIALRGVIVPAEPPYIQRGAERDRGSERESERESER